MVDRNRPLYDLGGGEDLLTVAYVPTNRPAMRHVALIPWTNNYETALASAQDSLRRHLQTGSAGQRRWLASRIQTPSGVALAEFNPEIFPRIILDPNLELQLCEDPAFDVTVLPIDHERTTTNEEVYYRFKIIAVGPMSVGKSMILQYFTKPEESRLNTLPPTTGPRLDVTNRFMTAQGVLVKIDLWDTAGQERFRSLTRSHYRGANGVLLVYDITDRDSFLNCAEWLVEVRRHVGENVPIMLIGNQVDRITERAVDTNEAQAFALEHRLLFAEVSGKEGTNVEQTFQRLVHGIFRGLRDRNELDNHRETGQHQVPPGLEDPPQENPPAGGCKC